ncbi:monovalent cation/H(+) antiporter subunit G [Bacillus testis]|uniref:monovalent cation/H(+) antiporter subunit G n=1 Tax=Bacillus testis TaxID=1622072 RepID=UPI00067F38D2|nr:monovalent cation/H(+) antiporter subunit G [Bacillus testis]
MIEISKIIAAIFILLGAFLSMVTAFGLIRLPDIYTRNHAASKSATLGIMSILLGTFIYFYGAHGHFNSRVLLGIFFIFFTAPVSGHLISRAAYNTGVKVCGQTCRDDLKTARERAAKKARD